MTGGVGEANRPFQGHWCLGAEHAAAALVAPASCAACRALPEEELLSRHLFFSPSVDLAEAIDLFGAEVPDADECLEVDSVASLDDVFPGSASEFSRSGASTEATIVPSERPRRMTDLFGEIMVEATAIKGIPMPAPPLAPRCGPSLASPTWKGGLILGWRPNEKPLPPDCLQKQITGLTDRVFVCASQSAAVVNNIAPALLCPGLLVGWQGGLRPRGGREMAGGFPLLQRHPSAVPAERANLVQGPLALDGLFGPRFSKVLAHQQAVRENRSWFGAILTGSRPVPALQVAASNRDAAVAAAAGGSSTAGPEVPQT
ncbi:unnamed protein product [Boreogadus saida]